jgi:exosortase F-associated protein
MNEVKPERWILGFGCAVGLLLIFIFQGVDVAEIFTAVEPGIGRFLINRSLRFLLNDACVIGLIYALFSDRKYVVFSLYVQVFGMIFILAPYFVIKVRFPQYNGPLVSFLHRLVLNPTLLLLLIPAFYYQRSRS